MPDQGTLTGMTPWLEFEGHFARQYRLPHCSEPIHHKTLHVSDYRGF